MLADEAIDVLLHVERIHPDQQRYAQLMEQPALLAPASQVNERAPIGDAATLVLS